MLVIYPFFKKNIKALKIYRGNFIIIGFTLIVNLINFRLYFYKIEGKNIDYYNYIWYTKSKVFINFIYKSFLLLLIKQALNFNSISFRAYFAFKVV